MSATSLDLSQIKTDALSSASMFRTLVGLGTSDAPTFKSLTLTSGTLTASAPVIDATQTWNNAAVTFSGLKLNVTDTASNASSLLMDLQVGGTSKFKVEKSGVTTATTAFVCSSGLFGDSSSISSLNGLDLSTSGHVMLRAGGARWFGVKSIGVVVSNAGGFGFAANGAATAFTTSIYEDAANTLAQRNGTNAQTFRLYGTYTDASNYERAKLEWSSNVLRIGTEKAGTGSARALELQTDGVTRLTIDTGGNATINTDVSTGSTPLTLKHNSVTKFSFSYSGTFNCGASSNEGLINLNSGYGYITTVGGSATTRHLQLRSYNGIDLDIGGLGGSGIKLLTFGGSTTSFPAIKRNAAALNFRLADDSADCDITAAALTLSGNLTISTKNIVTDTTTGTKIGTAATQKLGFWNATPIVQPTTAVGSATVSSPGGGSTIKTDDTFDGYTLQQVVKALRDTGILA